MSSSHFPAILIGGALALAAAIAFFLRPARNEPRSPDPRATAPAAAMPASPPVPSDAGTDRPPSTPDAATAPPASTTSPASPLPRTVAELNAMADGPLPLPDKIQRLAAMMRDGSPADARAAAVRAVFIVKNPDFTAHLQPLLLDSAIRREAMDVLALNAYDRPLEVLLPLWAAIAERPEHPLHDAARDGLAFHLGPAAEATGPALADAIRRRLGPPPR